jgi:hypothetical protein
LNRKYDECKVTKKYIGGFLKVLAILEPASHLMQILILDVFGRVAFWN